MSDDHPASFPSSEAEAAYWKEKYQEMRSLAHSTEMDLLEFQEQSSELEKELEGEVARLEKTCQDLTSRNQRYIMETEEWKMKYYDAKKEMNHSLSTMTRELEFVKSQQEKYKSRTRELEQDNDDLERFERAARTSLRDMETRYSRALERTVVLEAELEEKNQLMIDVQRLKDELKDLNLELNLLRSRQRKATQNNNAQPKNGSGLPPTPPPGSSGTKIPSASRSHHPDSSSSVIAGNDGMDNPVQMVQNIMGRVKNLETRLASCRSLVTPLLAPPHSSRSGIPSLASKSSLPMSASGGPMAAANSMSPLTRMRMARARSMRAELTRRANGPPGTTAPTGD
ncbi:NADH:ubiquinone oxidoreductase [Dimargaris cristalligena]|uniref:NUDE protein n=1 Tax=Dimargaris cristalligena TaxID=215637 RepID=A0A4P9ZWW7_9FUNG|nr:NADH:ubiquinone oxidoreductase [Dimargaris cristalligena]RKP38123.1 NUDE protein [Dimargaris cristalligena]|eukprot:RKP38123.1 NUDE protein [Dimargaris cristalligena]